MNNDLTWLSLEIEIRLNQLESYLNEIAIALKRSADDFEKRVRAEAAKMSEEERDRYLEWHSATYWEFNEVFPRMLNNSFMVSTYSFLETTILDIARRYEQLDPDGIRLKDLRGDGLQQCSIYLKKVHAIQFPDDTVEWETINTYRKIRNLITHNNSRLRQNGDEGVRDYIEKNSSHFKFDQFDQIETLEEGNEHFILTIREFLKQLLIAMKS